MKKYDMSFTEHALCELEIHEYKTKLMFCRREEGKGI
jgi:hypothetical protein